MSDPRVRPAYANLMQHAINYGCLTSTRALNGAAVRTLVNEGTRAQVREGAGPEEAQVTALYKEVRYNDARYR